MGQNEFILSVRTSYCAVSEKLLEKWIVDLTNIHIEYQMLEKLTSNLFLQNSFFCVS